MAMHDKSQIAWPELGPDRHPYRIPGSIHDTNLGEFVVDLSQKRSSPNAKYLFCRIISVTL
jgi:hypothetical protein